MIITCPSGAQQRFPKKQCPLGYLCIYTRRLQGLNTTTAFQKNSPCGGLQSFSIFAPRSLLQVPQTEFTGLTFSSRTPPPFFTREDQHRKYCIGHLAQSRPFHSPVSNTPSLSRENNRLGILWQGPVASPKKEKLVLSTHITARVRSHALPLELP